MVQDNDHGQTLIPGLLYRPNYIDVTAERELLGQIDCLAWRSDLKRRVQHYGYLYDYKARQITAKARLGAIPPWLSVWCRQLCEDGLFEKEPDQVIVNEYLPGQGIASHIDRPDCFGDRIASLSLGGSCMMEFKNGSTGAVISNFLKARSLIIMAGPARYEWQHGIRPRKTDTVGGRRLNRERRVSVTFRNVVGV